MIYPNRDDDDEMMETKLDDSWKIKCGGKYCNYCWRFDFINKLLSSYAQEKVYFGQLSWLILIYPFVVLSKENTKSFIEFLDCDSKLFFSVFVCPFSVKLSKTKKMIETEFILELTINCKLLHL